MGKHFTASLYIWIALAGNKPAHAQTSDAISVLAQAYQALSAKDYASAVAGFERALAAEPPLDPKKAASVHNDLAYTLLKIGENERARDHFSEAVRLDPADERAALEYAFLCNETQQPAEARRTFLRLRDGARDPANRATAAEAFEHLDRPLADGIARWQQALAAEPGNFSAHEELARLAEQRDQLILAAEHYQAASRLKPQRGDLLLDLGRVWQRMGRDSDARRAWLTAAQSSDPRVALEAREMLTKLAQSQAGGQPVAAAGATPRVAAGPVAQPTTVQPSAPQPSTPQPSTPVTVPTASTPARAAVPSTAAPPAAAPPTAAVPTAAVSTVAGSTAAEQRAAATAAAVAAAAGPNGAAPGATVPPVAFSANTPAITAPAAGATTAAVGQTPAAPTATASPAVEAPSSTALPAAVPPAAAPSTTEPSTRGPVAAGTDARTMAAKSLEKGYLEDALKYLWVAHETDPADFEVMLDMGRTYNTLKDDQEAIHWFDRARRSPDTRVAGEASKAYHNLAPALERFRTTVWAFPMFSSRWHDTFAYAQVKTELRVANWFVRPYLSVRFIGDLRGAVQTAGSVAPQYLSENSVIVGAGAATRSWRGATAWFEAGESLRYRTSSSDKAVAIPDYRGGISFAKGIGQMLRPGAHGRFAETNDDGVFVSRFSNDTIFYSQNRTGYTLRSAESLGGLHAQLYWNWNVTADVKSQYWANTAETGPGLRFRFEGLPSGMLFSVNALRGVYLINAGNPRRPNFDDLRVGIWYALTR